MAGRVPRASRRGPRSASPVGTLLELLLGGGLLGAAALAGAFLVERPGPNRADIAGDFYLPAATGSHVANELVKLGSLPVMIVGVVIVFALAIPRDWVRAFACALAPVVALVVVEHVAKPLVGREIGGGGLSYPSGTVTATTSLAMAFLVVAPRLVRPFVAIVGTIAVLGVSAAVIVLRWHYPTDVLGGICVGSGAVLFLDAAAHVPFLGRGRAAPWREDEDQPTELVPRI